MKKTKKLVYRSILYVHTMTSFFQSRMTIAILTTPRTATSTSGLPTLFFLYHLTYDQGNDHKQDNDDNKRT